MQATPKSQYISPYIYGGRWESDENGRYYVKENGERLTGATSGATSPKRIGAYYYAFDGDGYMLTGWVDEFGNRCTDPEGWENAVYYFGEDGIMALNCWKKIRVIDYETDTEDRDYWFYFDGKGQKVHNTEDSNYKDRIIDHEHYAFADDGHMFTGWQFTGAADDMENDLSLWRYFGSDTEMTGALKKTGWFKAIPADAFDATGYDNESERWFFAKSNGSLIHGELKNVSSKQYLFDTNGEMVTGLRWVDFDEDGKYTGCSGDLLEDSASLATLLSVYPDGKGIGKSGFYYFGNDGGRKSGKRTFKIDAEKYTVACR